MTSRMRLQRKQVDDVLGGDEMWAHADRTQGMTGLTVDGRGNLKFSLSNQPPATSVISTVPFSINFKYAQLMSL